MAVSPLATQAGAVVSVADRARQVREARGGAVREVADRAAWAKKTRESPMSSRGFRCDWNASKRSVRNVLGHGRLAPKVWVTASPAAFAAIRGEWVLTSWFEPW